MTSTIVATRVLIIEDHSLLAQSLRFALTAEGFDVEIADLETADPRTQFCTDPVADVVLLDLDLGGRIGDGMTLIAPLHSLGSKVLVITGNGDRMRHAGCLEQGAAAVLPKSTSCDRLVAAVRHLNSGGQLLRDTDRFALLNELREWRALRRESLAPYRQLTAREAEVLIALMDGKSCDSIAHEGFVSPATVRTQIRGVLTKLGVASQLAAVAAARRAGWRAS